MITRKLPYYEIEQGIYEIDEFDCVSIFVIVGTKRALVIDTGTGIGDLRWVIENKITNKPYDVVISHGHGDHNGGAGFFDEVWVHEADWDWNVAGVSPTLEFRRDYASIIQTREGKHYDYDLVTDIRPWEKEPEKKKLADGQKFDLGGRIVTAIHCPGHTPGQMVFLDDLTGTLLVSDACNCNFLLGAGVGNGLKDGVRIAKEGLERLLAMKGDWNRFYNGHHDFRGFGQSLYPEALEDVANCLERILNGTAEFTEEPDPLSKEGKTKKVARYGKVKISCIEGEIDRI